MAQIQPLNDQSIEQDPDQYHSAEHEGSVSNKGFGHYETKPHGHLPSRRDFANLCRRLTSSQKVSVAANLSLYLIDCADDVYRKLPARSQHRHQHPDIVVMQPG